MHQYGAAPVRAVAVPIEEVNGCKIGMWMDLVMVGVLAEVLNERIVVVLVVKLRSAGTVLMGMYDGC